MCMRLRYHFCVVAEDSFVSVATKLSNSTLVKRSLLVIMSLQERSYLNSDGIGKGICARGCGTVAAAGGPPHNNLCNI